MRQVQLHEEEVQFASLVSEAEAGESLTILRHGKPVAQIIPFPESSLEKDETRRLEAARRLGEMMEKGIHLGGLRITNRDELYDRD